MKLHLKSLLAGLAFLVVLPTSVMANPQGHGGSGGHFGKVTQRTFVAPAVQRQAVAPVQMRHFGGHAGGHFGGHGFARPGISHWRGGAWNHGYYGGRLGWWWVVGGYPYFYQQPVYPYPEQYQPPVVMVEPQSQVVVAPQAMDPAMAPQGALQGAPQPAPQTWHFCDASQTYYPYVSSCEGGWRAVPATPPGAPQ